MAQAVRIVSPPNWLPYPVITVIAAARPVPVMGPRRGRVAAVIVNTGAASAQVLSTDSQTAGVTLQPGTPLTIEAEGAVFVSSTAGTTIEALETWWDPASGSEPGAPRVDIARALGQA